MCRAAQAPAKRPAWVGPLRRLEIGRQLEPDARGFVISCDDGKVVFLPGDWQAEELGVEPRERSRVGTDHDHVVKASEHGSILPPTARRSPGRRGYRHRGFSCRRATRHGAAPSGSKAAQHRGSRDSKVGTGRSSAVTAPRYVVRPAPARVGTAMTYTADPRVDAYIDALPA